MVDDIVDCCRAVAYMYSALMRPDNHTPTGAEPAVMLLMMMVMMVMITNIYLFICLLLISYTNH